MKKNKKLISLNKKIVLSFSIPILIFILVLNIMVNKIFKSKFKDYIALKQIHTMENINFEVHRSYIDNKWDIGKIEEIGEGLFKTGIILEIKDSLGNNVWSRYDYDEKGCKRLFLEIKENMKDINPKWEGKIVNEQTPIYNDENVLIGYKVLTYFDDIVYMAEELLFIQTINNILMLIGLLSILFIFIITVIISKNISNPIKRVSSITKNIGQGDYKNLQYDGNIREVSDLILSINTLSSTLESQEKIRKRLITDLSHELANPLTSIHGHLRAIIDGIWQSSIDRLVSIDNELLRVINLIRQLKKLNKLENEKLSKEETNLSKLINDVIYNLEASAIDKDIGIKYELEDVIANVDKNKISQIVVNILSNAIKYTNSGGEIVIRLYEDKDKIYISIKDNGIGIDEDEIDHIFERFYRVDNATSKKNEGLGVGLSISKFIINQHNGDIKVYSDINKGSEFKIILRK